MSIKMSIKTQQNKNNLKNIVLIIFENIKKKIYIYIGTKYSSLYS